MAGHLSETAIRFLGGRAVIAGVLAILMVYGVEAHARSRDRSSPATLGDQDAYLGYARHLYESNYTVTEDRNRMPVYPFLLSLIYRPGMTDDEFLVRAQSFTVNLSIVLLLPLFLIFRRFLPPWPSLALLAATAFGVFIYRAGKAQVELLFYFVSFCVFVLLLQMFVRPRWWLAVLAGATTGLAHLTHGIDSARAHHLGIRVRLADSLASARQTVAFPWSAPGRPGEFSGRGLSLHPDQQKDLRRLVLQRELDLRHVVRFLDRSLRFLAAHGDKDQWREVPPDERPSFHKYWREHSVIQMVKRVGTGARNLATRNLRVIGYYKFVLSLLVTIAILAMLARRQAREFLARNAFAALFCLLFCDYYLLYAWYDAIISDSRFVLSIFLPFLFAASVFLLSVGTDRIVSLAGRRIPFDRFFSGVFLSLAAIDVVYNAAGVWS